MKKYIYNVTEDNGGGITLNVWMRRSGRYVYAHNGFEYGNPKDLLDCIAALDAGEDIEGWEGNDLCDEEAIRYIRGRHSSGGYDPAPDSAVYTRSGNVRRLTEDEYYDNSEYTKIIYDNDGPADYDSMGYAGSNIFYPDGDPADAEDDE